MAVNLSGLKPLLQGKAARVLRELQVKALPVLWERL